MKYLFLLVILSACATPVYRPPIQAPDGECTCDCKYKKDEVRIQPYRPRGGEARGL